MRFAIITEAVGITKTLASTAFIASLSEGLQLNGHDVTVVGLAQSETMWAPSALTDVRTSTPLMHMGCGTVREAFSAYRSGVLDIELDERRQWGWFAEHLLDTELRRLAGDSGQLTVVFYPRSYELLWAVSRICRRAGSQLVVMATEALTDLQIDHRTRSHYMDLVVTRADAVFCVSRRLAAFWQDSGVEPQRVYVHPSITRMASFAIDRDPPGTKSALFLGNLANQEVDNLLAIAELVQDRHPEFKLRIVGDAAAERIESLRMQIDELGLTGAVDVEPARPLGEVPALLAEADLLLMPRESGERSASGFPNKMGEYLASGRAIVVTAVGDISTYVRSGQEAVLVQPDDNEGFASAVSGLLEHPDQARELGHRARCLAEQLSKPDVVAAEFATFAATLVPRDSGDDAISGTRSLRQLWSALAFLERTKRFVVRILRFLRLKPQAPGYESRP